MKRKYAGAVGFVSTLAAAYVLVAVRDMQVVRLGPEHTWKLVSATALLTIPLSRFSPRSVEEFKRFITLLSMILCLLWLVDTYMLTSDLGTWNEKLIIGFFNVVIEGLKVTLISAAWAVASDYFDFHAESSTVVLFSLASTIGQLSGSFLVNLTLAFEMSTFLLLFVAVLLLQLSSFAFSHGFSEKHRVKASKFNQNIKNTLEITKTKVFFTSMGLFVLFSNLSNSMFYVERIAFMKTHRFSIQETGQVSAEINFYSGLLTFSLQVFQFLTSWEKSSFSAIELGLGLFSLPVITLFWTLFSQTNREIIRLNYLIWIEVARRTTSFVFTKPSREILYSRLPTKQKHEIKGFIDTVVFKLGNVIGALIVPAASNDFKVTSILIGFLWFFVSYKLLELYFFVPHQNQKDKCT